MHGVVQKLSRSLWLVLTLENNFSCVFVESNLHNIILILLTVSLRETFKKRRGKKAGRRRGRSFDKVELLHFDACCQGKVNQLQQVWKFCSAQFSHLLNKTRLSCSKQDSFLSPSWHSQWCCDIKYSWYFLFCVLEADMDLCGLLDSLGHLRSVLIHLLWNKGEQKEWRLWYLYIW